MAVSPVKSELFTALVHMEGLMELELDLLGSLNSYIATEKLRYLCASAGSLSEQR